MSIGIKDSLTIRKENHHILLSNKEKCRVILNKNERTPEDIIDFLISLHLVLEVGLNGFYRQIILNQLQKTIKEDKIANNLDNINFIDKTMLFFYLPHFDFRGKINKADEYHGAIGKLRNFSEIRNKLLHGHMNGQMFYVTEGRTTQTRAFEFSSEDTMKTQIESFLFILEAVRFYFDHLESSFSEKGKEDIKKFHLDIDFFK